MIIEDAESRLVIIHPQLDGGLFFLEKINLLDWTLLHASTIICDPYEDKYIKISCIGGDFLYYAGDHYLTFRGDVEHGIYMAQRGKDKESFWWPKGHKGIPKLCLWMDSVANKILELREKSDYNL